MGTSCHPCGPRLEHPLLTPCPLKIRNMSDSHLPTSALSYCTCPRTWTPTSQRERDLWCVGPVAFTCYCHQWVLTSCQKSSFKPKLDAEVQLEELQIISSYSDFSACGCSLTAAWGCPYVQKRPSAGCNLQVKTGSAVASLGASVSCAFYPEVLPSVEAKACDEGCFHCRERQAAEPDCRGWRPATHPTSSGCHTTFPVIHLSMQAAQPSSACPS